MAGAVGRLRAMPTIAVLGDRDPRFVTHRELDAELARMPAGVEAAWLPSPRAAEAARCRRDLGRARDALRGRRRGARRAGRARSRTARRCWAPAAASSTWRSRWRGAPGSPRRARTPTRGPRTRWSRRWPARSWARSARSPASRARGWRRSAAPRRSPASTSATSVWRPRTSPGSRPRASWSSAHAPDAGVEGIELPSHPFLLATLFQPQVGALAGRPRHPLVAAFVAAASGLGGLDERVEAA